MFDPAHSNRKETDSQNLGNSSMPAVPLLDEREAKRVCGSILDAFVGHFSPGSDQLEEYYRNQRAAASQPLGPIASSLKDLLTEFGDPAKSTQHAGIAGQIRSAATARNRSDLLDGIEAFANASTNGKYDEIKTRQDEERCFRDSRAVKKQLEEAQEIPWEELGRI